MRLLRIFLIAVYIFSLVSIGEAAGKASISSLELHASGYLTAKYPTVSIRGNEKVQGYINNDIKQFVRERIDEIQLLNSEVELKTGELGYVIPYEGADVLSFKFTKYTMIEKGARPNIEIFGLSFNKNNGAKLTTLDVQRITTEDVKNALQKHFKKMNIDISGDLDKVDRVPQNFYLDEQGRIVLIIQRGEMLPPPLGTVELIVFE